MSLKLLQPGTQPLGQFDGLDSQVLSLKGGEVVTLKSVVATSATDKAASDVFDGYSNPSSVQHRPVVQLAADGYARPLMLSDEGILGYGTLFGAVVGGTVGQQSNGPNSYTGAVLGPHTATGSGKVTCWDKPGLYAVSLDACDTASSTGLQPTNTTIDTGSALYYTSAGLLTPNVGASVAGLNNTFPVVGRFVAFDTNGSLVSTPNKLVAALNSPSGLVTSVGPGQFAFATFYFAPPLT
jgi:hypothetical protein